MEIETRTEDAALPKRWEFFKCCVKWCKHKGCALTIEFVEDCLNLDSDDGEDMVSEDEWRRLQKYATSEKVPITRSWDGDTALH